MKLRYLTPFAVLMLAACSSSPPPPPQNFPALDYSYLPPIVLKVANLSIVNNYVPSPDAATLIGQDPQAPATALLAMLNHRMAASGAPGSGTITVQDASLNEENGTISGAMTVDINLTSPDGRSTGFAEASVSASQTAPAADAPPGTIQAALYGLTKRLMEDMNVQLQYQIQHNLGAWISWPASPGSNAAASESDTSDGVIQAMPLTAPASADGASPPVPVPGGPINSNNAVPDYLPGAGPATLNTGSAP